MRKISIFLSIAMLSVAAAPSGAHAAFFSFQPEQIIQGDPIMARLEGLEPFLQVKKISFGGKQVKFFTYQGKPTVILGFDLNRKAGAYEFVAELTDGSLVKSFVNVGEREKYEAPLGIPEKLGGNTKASQDRLVTNLALEKKATSGLRTNKNALWTEKFKPPLKNIFVTDPYGFSRKTGEYSIAHKGVDYRAPEGTEVMATNRGVVRVAKTFKSYGKTVVIDHGLGLQSFYLHLSKINVKVGDVVEQGKVIGLAGNSGYSIGAHLHFAIRINDIGIDPVKFLEIFK